MSRTNLYMAISGILVTVCVSLNLSYCQDAPEQPVPQQTDQPASAESFRLVDLSQALSLNETTGMGTLSIDQKSEAGKALAELRKMLANKGFKPLEIFAVKGDAEDAVKAARDYIVKGQQPTRQFAKDDKVLLVFYTRPFDVADITLTAVSQSPGAIEIGFKFDQPAGGQKPKKIEQLILIPVTLSDVGKIKLEIFREKGKMTKAYFDTWTKDTICASSELTVTAGQEKKLSNSELEELIVKTLKDKAGETGDPKVTTLASECDLLGKTDMPNPLDAAIIRTFIPSDSAKPRQFVCARRDGSVIFPFKAEQLKEVLRDEDMSHWSDEHAIQLATVCVHLTDPANETGWVVFGKPEENAAIKGLPKEAQKIKTAAPAVFKKDGNIIVTLYAWHVATGSLKQWIIVFGKTFEIRPKELGKFKPEN